MRRGTSTLALLGLSALGVVAGCSVTPKQAYELRRLLPSAEKREAERLAAVAWRLRFAGAEYLVLPTTTPEGGLVFYGANGLQVSFDGREVTAIERLPGAYGSLRVEKSGDERRYVRGGRRTYAVRCSPSIEWQVRPGQAGWRMECRGSLNDTPVVIRHTVDWDANRVPTRISATIAPGTAPLVLTAPKK